MSKFNVVRYSSIMSMHIFGPVKKSKDEYVRVCFVNISIISNVGLSIDA